MGVGGAFEPPETAEDWNSGSCDVMAVALHRLYGLPLMAEFEYGQDEQGEEMLGFLIHAWVRLPDGRMLDAAGPQPMWDPTEGADPNDAWVQGYRVVELRDDDSHLLRIREEDDYVEDIETMEAAAWIQKHLAPELEALGLFPRDSIYPASNCTTREKVRPAP